MKKTGLKELDFGSEKDQREIRKRFGDGFKKLKDIAPLK